MTEDQLTKILDQQFAQFFGKLTKHFDERINAVRDELKADIDGVRNTVDGIAKRLEDDATEQAIINNRHEGWIGQLAKNTGTNMTPTLE